MSVSMARSHSGAGNPRARRRWASSCTLRSRWRSARSAHSSASSPTIARRPVSALDADGLRVLDLDLHRLLRMRLGRKETGRNDLLFGGLRLDPDQNLLDDVGVLGEESGGVLPPLAQAVVAEAEVGTGLLHDLPLECDVEDSSLPRDSRPVDDVELGLLERRGDLVLDHLDANSIAERLGAVLERLDTADVETHRRVELERPATWGRLRVSAHDADLLAELVREDADRVRAVERACELAQRLAHQAGLEAHVGVTHLAFDLGFRDESGDRVDCDHV